MIGAMYRNLRRLHHTASIYWPGVCCTSTAPHYRCLRAARTHGAALGLRPTELYSFVFTTVYCPRPVVRGVCQTGQAMRQIPTVRACRPQRPGGLRTRPHYTVGYNQTEDQRHRTAVGGRRDTMDRCLSGCDAWHDPRTECHDQVPVPRTRRDAYSRSASCSRATVQ